MHYGRTHVAHGIGGWLDVEVDDALALPVVSAGRLKDEPLICRPPAPRLLWLRRGAALAANMVLAALIP